MIDRNSAYLSLSPYGEPQLGRRGLYGQISAGSPRDGEMFHRAILWVLNLADGQHSLLDVAERAGLPFAEVAKAAEALVEADLLQELPG